MGISDTFRPNPRRRALLSTVALLLVMSACGDSSSDPYSIGGTDPAAGQTGLPTAPTGPAAGRTGTECIESYRIRSTVNIPATGGGPRHGSGVLEQRALETELVVRAELVDVELKVVESQAIKFELAGFPSTDRYILLHEVELRVHEYLKGEGPNTVTAVVEGQLAFNSLEEAGCAKRILTEEVGPLFQSDEGIAFLESTSDPNFYHMGLAYENFKGLYGHHSTWLPHRDGSFHNRGPDGWMSPTEVRQRIASVLEEYGRRDDERWRSCVFDKYFSQGSDPWAYQGFQIPFHRYRDHNIIFNGEHVPVPAGTMIWISPGGDYRDATGRKLSLSLSMRLEGRNADLFEVTYHPEYEYTANGWVGTSGGMGYRLAIWHKPREGETDQWQSTIAGHVITAAQDLRKGEYRFDLHTEYEGVDFVDCGQGDAGPSRFTVIVDKNRSVGR